MSFARFPILILAFAPVVLACSGMTPPDRERDRVASRHGGASPKDTGLHGRVLAGSKSAASSHDLVWKSYASDKLRSLEEPPEPNLDRKLAVCRL